MFDWILDLVRTLGYPGIALLTLIENVVPPIPSELIMPFAGFLAERGELALFGAVAAGTAGSLAGAIGWYVVGRRVGEERVRTFFARHGRWAALGGDDIDRAMRWFRRHGGSAVLIGRLALGTSAWTAAFTYAGVLLGRNYQTVEEVVGVATWVIVGGIIAWYAYRVATHDATGDERPEAARP